ncbi:unnamed protein product [Adineta ricciae]|uniref:G-protein coupled receptors family 1 profile domain-containing protein n=1 Tax=Adineta ricciae TaxID=249248 RepID=A0A815S7X5_ADIRI|nr:unnamed protein product [Adineta ricciae]
MLFLTQNQQVAFVFSIISTIENIFACLISLIILTIIVSKFFYKQVKYEDKSILVLCVNVYLCAFVCELIFCSYDAQSILGDIYQINFNSLRCVLTAYAYCGFIFNLLISLVNQAFYRLCRIVYPQYRWLQSPSFYVILPPIQLILAFVLLCPTYIWQDIIYLPEDHFCFIPLSRIRSFLWLFFVAYGIPVLLLSFLYFRIILFLRKQTKNQTFVVRRQQNRDFVAIQRILIIVGILLLLGMPAAIFLIMMFITGKEHPLTPRFLLFSVGLSVLVLNVAIVFSVVQLKNIIWKTFKSNVIVPLIFSIDGTDPQRNNNSIR